MKDRIPKTQKELQAEQPKRPKFIPCERETGGGAQKPGTGTTCCGGQMFYWASYQGKMERYAKDCSCVIAWRNGFTASPSKSPHAVLPAADSKARAAGNA